MISPDFDFKRKFNSKPGLSTLTLFHVLLNNSLSKGKANSVKIFIPS